MKPVIRIGYLVDIASKCGTYKHTGVVVGGICEIGQVYSDLKTLSVDPDDVLKIKVENGDLIDIHHDYWEIQCWGAA